MAKNPRINTVLFFIFLGGGILLSRLFCLQVLDNRFYKAQATGQQNFITEEEGKRGDIFFENGELLALTKDTPYIFISPEEIKDKEQTAKILASVINIRKEDLVEEMSVVGSMYKVIMKDVSDDLVKKIEDLKLEGIHIGYDKKRYYPNESIASKVVGFINAEGIGQYGLEGYYNKEISGIKKTQKKENNPWQFLFSSSENESLDGESLTLTIDYNIQFQAENIIKDGVEKYKAKSGEIIVMDPGTGAILAMAQYPNFNPNNYKDEPYELFQNNSIQKLFEPGSIFKPITMSIALNEGLVTPETTFEDNTGYVWYGKYKVSNYDSKAWGNVTMTKVLEKSINTGVIYVENLIGHNKFLDYVENYGFFKKTGIDLAGEVSSENKEIKKALTQKIEVTFANASFGQGINITPLQITTAFCAIANGGNLVKPYVVKKISDKEIEQETAKKIISLETSNTLKTMLVSVVDNGYGHAGKVDGYYIAAKTGTSQIPWSSLGIDKPGYSDETWQTYLGFAPAYNPQFVTLVKLDSPETLTSEYSAGPIFHDITEYILKYKQIAPDYQVDKKE
jgi:stage V sporulation protein D (sporulation-specific penicillin-binding protein)